MNREIRAYSSETKSRVIDFLFISHLHFDHVSGIKELLDSTKFGSNVDTIVLPLLDPIETLVEFSYSLSADRSIGSDKFYCDLIADPIGTLDSFNPRIIIQVAQGNRGAGFGAPDDFEPRDPDYRGDEDIDSENPFPQPGHSKMIGSGTILSSPSKSGSSEEDFALRRTDAHKYRIPDTVGFLASLSNGEGWLLSTYVDPALRGYRTVFQDVLAEELGLSLADLKRSISDIKFRRDLVVRHQKKLKKAFTAIAGDVNTTSMSLLSTAAPISNQQALSLHAYGDPAKRWFQTSSHGSAVGWLGTGDSKLGNRRRRREFLKHFDRYREKIFTLAVPHHGSNSDFHPSILKAIKPELCTVAADRFRNWNHPSSAIVQMIASAGIEFRTITSSPQSRLKEYHLVI